MVHAFIIHTLLPGSSNVLHWSTFRQEPQLIHEAREPGTDWHSVRKAHIEYVAEKVHAEYQFRRTVSGLSLDEDLSRASSVDTGLGLPDLECGLVRMAEHAPFPTEKVVVWYGAGTLAFCLVCHKNENRLLAEANLKHVIRYLQEYLLVFSQPSEILQKVDRIIQIVHHLIPDGQLIFMNHRVIRQLEKELDLMMKHGE